MKYIKAVMCLGLLFFLSNGKVRALEPVYDIRIDEIRIMPTATPTPIAIEFRPVEMMPLTTATPTPLQVVVTQVVTATPIPETEIETSPTVVQNPTTELGLTATQEEIIKTDEEKTDEKNDLSKWFWQITVGMLVLIVIIQLWPKKKEGVKDKKDDLQP